MLYDGYVGKSKNIDLLPIRIQSLKKRDWEPTTKPKCDCFRLNCLLFLFSFWLCEAGADVDCYFLPLLSSLRLEWHIHFCDALDLEINWLPLISSKFKHTCKIYVCLNSTKRNGKSNDFLCGQFISHTHTHKQTGT